MGKNNIKLTIEEVRMIIESEGYKLISNAYVNANTKIKVECPNGHQYGVKLGNFRTGNRCNECMKKVRGKKQRLSPSEVEDFIKKEGYNLITGYTKAKDKMTLKCPKQHEYEVTWDKFRQGRRCPICCGNKPKDIEFVRNHVNSMGYSLLSELYSNAQTKLIIMCDKGHTYESNWMKLSMGCKCPYCYISKGEERVAKYLDNREIEYEQQKTFDRCCGKTGCSLRFDFYLPEHNICIEYDGEQHFKPITFGGSEEQAKIRYNNLVENDTRKNSYCEDNQIRLIRIPYWDFNNIELIIETELEKTSTTK